MIKSAALLALVLGSSPLLGAQAPTAGHDITRMTGGVEISTADNVKVTADQAEINRTTGEVMLSGNVVLRQNLRTALNAGEPFPAPKDATVRLRGNFELTVGDLIVQAEEADVNGLTGEIALRGNVRMRNPKWAVKPLP